MGKTAGLYLRGSIYWLSRDPLTGEPASTRCRTIEAARAVLAERERLANDPSYAAAAQASLIQQCEGFVEDKIRAKRAEATIGFYREKLGHWVRIFGPDARLCVFTPTAFDRYVAQRRDEGAHDHTIHKEQRVFRQVLHRAKRRGLYAGELSVLKPEDLTPSYTPRERALPSDEVALLWRELSPTLQALLDISVALGVRRAEALRLTPEDVDLPRGLVFVRGTKTKASRRTIPVLSVFRPLLERALPQLPLVNCPNNLYRDLASACRRVGIEPCTPNDFRRSHATILAELGASEEATAKLLGHTSTDMVRRIYSRPRAAALGALIERSLTVVEPATIESNSEGLRRAK